MRASRLLLIAEFSKSGIIAQGVPERIEPEKGRRKHKAFLEEQCKVREQEATIAQLKSTVAKQDAAIARQQQGMETVAARLNEQAAQIQKVSAQIEANKPEAKVVRNNP